LLLETRLAKLALTQKAVDVRGFHSTNGFSQGHNCPLMDVVVVVVVEEEEEEEEEQQQVNNYKKKYGVLCAVISCTPVESLQENQIQNIPPLSALYVLNSGLFWLHLNSFLIYVQAYPFRL
jgi:hypothetical protein